LQFDVDVAEQQPGDSQRPTQHMSDGHQRPTGEPSEDQKEDGSDNERSKSEEAHRVIDRYNLNVVI
jgi:hypothetical protein